ncbi:hypothetical protein H4582DRAFT_512585 [Lactarius indigo]|nr:hypothetical protein H4582DRAFT_512585 [Lactarius indigo]
MFDGRSPGAAAAAARATQYLFHYWTLSLFASALARNSDSRRSENGHVGPTNRSATLRSVSNSRIHRSHCGITSPFPSNGQLTWLSFSR